MSYKRSFRPDFFKNEQIIILIANNNHDIVFSTQSTTVAILNQLGEILETKADFNETCSSRIASVAVISLKSDSELGQLLHSLEKDGTERRVFLGDAFDEARVHSLDLSERGHLSLHKVQRYRVADSRELLENVRRVVPEAARDALVQHRPVHECLEVVWLCLRCRRNFDVLLE